MDDRIWHSPESHIKNLLLKNKPPRTFWFYSIIKSVFIQPLEEETTTQRILKTLSDFDSHFASLNAINGFHLVSTVFASKYTDNQDFSWPFLTLGAPALSTVMLDAISAQTGVSSIAKLFDDE